MVEGGSLQNCMRKRTASSNLALVTFTIYKFFMVSVAEWFRRKFVELVYDSSILFWHPITGFVVEP